MNERRRLAVETMPWSARKHPALKLAMPMVTLALVFATIEAGFRIAEAGAARHLTETWAIYDPDLGYRLNPGFGDINAQGLRDDPITPKGRRFRLLMLGDSVGYYGDDIDDTYVGRLRRTLQQTTGGQSLDVLNASIRGYTNYQELVFLKKYGLAFEPDLVGVGFVLNDLHKILHQFKVQDDRIVGETYDFTPEAVKTVNNWFYQTARKSQLLVWLRRRLDTAFATVEYKVDQGYSFDYRPDVNTAWKDGYWSTIESQMREMVALGREHGFRVFVVVFPFGDQYRPEYLARDRAYVMKPQRLLEDLCVRLGIPYLDLYEQLDPGGLEPDQIHLTRSGRQRTAEAITGFLTAKGLLPVHAGVR